MKLYIKNAYVQQKPGFIVCNDLGEKKYSVFIEHSVLGMKLDLFNSNDKRISKIRQHGLSFNKTYNITAEEKKIKLILKVCENNISAFIKGYPAVIIGDILKKEFSVQDEDKSIIMAHKYNFKNYYELDIMREDFELFSVCVSLCIDTLLFFDEKKDQKNKDFFAEYILNNKKKLGLLPKTFSKDIKKLKNKD